MRFLMGVTQAFYNPTAFSVTSDLFAKSYRTTANSVFNLGIYFGGAMASLSGILILSVGWRLTYEISAYAGIGFALLGIFLIPDVERNKFDPKPMKTATDNEPQPSVISKFSSALYEIVITNPTCRWVVLAAGFKF